MTKIIRQQYITGEKGVSAFNSYCTNHNPFLIFREEQKHDFGIDGEIELSRITEDKKTEATGKILKVQLKATKKGSYIGKNDENFFEFNAKKNDIEYWKKHDIPVVLVVYFEETDELYAKKIDETLIANNKKKSQKIIFDKKLNLLDNTLNNFVEVIGQEFVERIDYGQKERLYSNLLKISTPKFLLCYQSNFKQIGKIFDILKEHEMSLPPFTLESDNFYTFSNLKDFPFEVKEKLFKDFTPKKINFENFTESNDNKRLAVKLINQFFKSFFYHKRISYNKDFNRYYFAKINEDPISIKEKNENKSVEIYRTEKYRARVNYSTRNVVSKYLYYDTYFIKHLGFQIHFEWIENELYCMIEPKYFYTEDGINPIDNPKRITRLSNQLKSTERNEHYLNHLFFFRNYFSGNKFWKLGYEEPHILVSRKVYFDVAFKIKGMKIRKVEEDEESLGQLKLSF